MKTALLSTLLLLSAVAYAAEPIKLNIWSDGAPNSNEMTEQVENGPIYVAEPTIEVYLPAKPNGVAIVACPGGGYSHLAMEHEGRDMADWFNGQGITYAVLTYRMPNGHSDVPLSDALQAIKLMRQHAEEWHINKVGIMGSSAGGHLASTAATHFTDSEDRPDFQILFYPVVTMRDYTHKGSRTGLLGSDPTDEQIALFSNELQVTEQTPPAFIMHSTDDNAVPVLNSVNYYLSLLEHGVSATMHIYPIGGHGWGYRDGFAYKRQWTGELEKWLREISLDNIL